MSRPVHGPEVTGAEFVSRNFHDHPGAASAYVIAALRAALVARRNARTARQRRHAELLCRRAEAAAQTLAELQGATS